MKGIKVHYLSSINPFAKPPPPLLQIAREYKIYSYCLLAIGLTVSSTNFILDYLNNSRQILLNETHI
jgi:hypothetical protein